MIDTYSVDEAKSILAGINWVWSVTFEKFAPHWWTHRKDWDQDDFVQMVATIYKYGVEGKWRNRTFNYLRPGDGYQYWCMGAHPKETEIINRATWTPK